MGIPKALKEANQIILSLKPLQKSMFISMPERVKNPNLNLPKELFLTIWHFILKKIKPSPLLLFTVKLSPCQVINGINFIESSRKQEQAYGVFSKTLS